MTNLMIIHYPTEMNDSILLKFCPEAEIEMQQFTTTLK